MKYMLKTRTLITTTIIAVLLGILALVLFFGTARHAPQAVAEETAPSYTTTDKLYLSLKHADNTTLTTLGGTVNGYGYRDRKSVV